MFRTILLFAVFAIGLIASTGHAFSQAGTFCGAASDTNVGASTGGAIFLDANPASSSCVGAGGPISIFDGAQFDTVILIGIYTNGGNSINIEHGDDITNVVTNAIRGAFVGTDPGTATITTADAFYVTVQFDIGGSTFNFDVIKDAGNDTLNGFTVRAGALVAQDIDVLGIGTGGNAPITNGSTTISTVLATDFGSVTANAVSESSVQRFRINSVGDAPLIFDADALTITGPDAGDFAPGFDIPNNLVLPFNTGRTFTINFNPTAVGTRNATVNIHSNDPNEDPFTFAIQGVGAGDTTPPAFTIPADITVANDPGLATAVVNFNVFAVDNVDGVVTPTIITTPMAGLASGSAFPVGTTTVSIEATDAAGNMSQTSFTVTVNDTEAPTVTAPADITVDTDPGANSAVVTFMASSTDNVGVESQVADFPSGTAFPAGSTIVTVTATDAAGNAGTDTFTVTVNDNEAPNVVAPANITVPTDPGVNTAVVNFVVADATDNVDPPITPVVTSSPTAGLNSGSAFPIGVTTLTLTATDSEGNSAQAQFQVTVTNSGPAITGGAAASFTVPENTAAVTDVEATDDSDSEGAGLTYSLTSTGTGPGIDNAQFTLDATTGVLAFSPAPDFENPTDDGLNNVYQVQVTVTDSGGLTDTQNITVTVTDEVEGPTAEETQLVIADFLQNRANHIIGTQPSMIDQFTGESGSGGGPLGLLAIDGNEAGMTLAFATSRSKFLSGMAQGRVNQAFDTSSSANSPPSSVMHYTQDANAGVEALNKAQVEIDDAVLDEVEENLVQFGDRQEAAEAYGTVADRTGDWDVWTEIYGARGSSGTSDSSLWVGYVGAHVFISADTLVGIMGQLDWADESNSAVNSKADGFGWMVGPYIAGRIPGQNLYYEARASWGQSDNDVSPIGTFTDSFDTERWMVMAKIQGAWEMGDFTIRPQTQVTYFEETQESYTDSVGTFIPSQTVSLGEIRFGPVIDWERVLDNGVVFKPSLGVAGVFNFNTSNNNATQGFLLGDNDLRARVEAGISVTTPTGVILAAAGFYDGLGISGYDAYGGTLRLTVPVN